LLRSFGLEWQIISKGWIPSWRPLFRGVHFLPPLLFGVLPRSLNCQSN
jgi:hypothetical protein